MSVTLNITLPFAKRVAIVANFYGVTVAELEARGRYHPLRTARHVAVYFCRRGKCRYDQVLGEAFGRTRYLVRYAIVEIERRLSVDPALRAELERIRDLIVEAIGNGGAR